MKSGSLSWRNGRRAATFKTTNLQWQKLTLTAHPRLFADAARFAVLKTQNDAVSQQLVALLRSEADKSLRAEPIVYPREGFLMWPMREVQGRILTLAMMYRLSGEWRYFERARQELLQLAAFPEWRPGHFLDVGEGALAAAIGLDWLYDDLTPPEREQIARAIIENALIPSLDVPIGGNSWMNGDFNWNPVCNAGLTAGALAVYEYEPELARHVIERAIESLPFAAATYAPDGTYPEGPSYWSYGTTFYVILVEALRSSLRTSLNLEKAPGFLGTADFMTQMKSPSGEEYNFSDYHGDEARTLSEPVMLWFARERRSRATAQEELKNLQTLFDLLQTTSASPRVSRHLALELLWWDPTLPPSTQDANLPLHWTSGGRLPLAVLRSAWDSPCATYVAVKGGTPNGSHAHMDCGSFILEANGVRWAVDLGTESYDKMRAANLDLWNYSQESSRWTTFRVGPEGHNILRFNSARQDVSGKAEICILPNENGVSGNVVDLSALYKGQVERVQRMVRLLSDRSVSFLDEWTTGERSAQVAWQWLTRATATRTKRGVLLSQAGQHLELKIESSAPLTIEIEDVSRPKKPQDSANPGLSRIVVHLQTAARSQGRLDVQAIPSH